MVKHGLTLLILTAALSQPASALANAASGVKPHVGADRFQRWRSEAVRLLGARADANAVATAAVLKFAGGPQAAPSEPTALQLISRASDLAPENAAIGWLHLQLCAGTPACDSRDAATVLRWVDPDNSAAWLAALATAQKDKDHIEVDRLLADMARGTRFDLYYNQLMVLMFDSLRAVRRELPGGVVASDTARLTALAGVATAGIIPPFSPLIDACRLASARGERHEDCLKLGKIMQKGDTVIVQMVGFGIEKRLIPVDSKEARSLAERRHLLEWRLASAGKLDSAILPWTLSARTRTRLAEMRAKPREEDVCIALLRAHKMALGPPENHP